MTGLYPSFTTVDMENGKYPLDSGTLTLAEIARAAGLRTAAVVSNPVLSRRLNLHQGFESYNEEIRYFDRQLGRLFEYLEGENLLKKTLVAFTADHGEAFGEDEFYCAHGHGSGLDQTRMPLGFVGPGVAGGVTLTAAVSAVDVFATLLEAMGLACPADTRSHSLLPALAVGREPDGRVGFSESVTQRAVFSGRFYLRRDRRPLDDHAFWQSANPYTGAPHIPLGRILATSLGKSMGEEEGFSHPDRLTPALQRLNRELVRFAAAADETSAILAPLRVNRYERSMDAEEQRQLQALGYME